jgi:hypothetical protein
MESETRKCIFGGSVGYGTGMRVGRGDRRSIFGQIDEYECFETRLGMGRACALLWGNVRDGTVRCFIIVIEEGYNV